MDLRNQEMELLQELQDPPEVKEFSKERRQIIEKKIDSVDKQDFGKAELLREQEKVLMVKILAPKNKGRTKTERRKFESQGGNSSLVVSLVTELDFQHIVSSWTGIPVENISSNKSKHLLKMEEALRKRVIGQDKAIEAISFAIRRARVGLKDPNRPIGSYIFWEPDLLFGPNKKALFGPIRG